MKYSTMQDYIADRDYIHIDQYKDIDFYTPNDEDWGGIIAVDHKNELVMATSFFEMDDMIPPSDYEIIYNNGELKFKFQTEV